MTATPSHTGPSTGPAHTGPDARFQAYLEAGEFRLQQCGNCGHWAFFPRVMCPACASRDLVWRKVSGRGRVYSRAVLKRKPDRGGDHAIVLVTLEEGPRLLSRLPDTPADEIAVGMPVRARVARAGEGALTVVFEPVGEDG